MKTLRTNAVKRRSFLAATAIIALSLTVCKNGTTPTPPTPPTPTPVAADYDIGNLTQTVGSVTAVTITPKAGKSSGAVTIYYAGTGGTTYSKSTTVPSAAGTYAVTFNVAAATGWNAASGLSAGTLTINALIPGNQTPVAADYVIGNLTQTVGSVTAVTITPKDGKSSGEVTIFYNGSTTLPIAVGTYPVTFDVAAVTGWNAASGLSAGTLTINALIPGNQTPVAADYDISGIGTFTYDGSARTVTVTAKSGKSPGAITIKYNGSTTAPSVEGTYAVTFDVETVTGWNAATGLSAGTLTITTINQTPVADDYDISGTGTFTYNGSARTVTVTAKSGKSPGAVTVKYNGSTTAPSAVGAYTVTFDVAAVTGWNAATGLSVGTLTINWPLFEMVQVPGGSFVMGKELGTAGEGDITPVHTVTLGSFYMGKYQVTQAQYQAVMGSNPSDFSSDPASEEVQGNRPVDSVSWYDAIVFCNRLSMAEGLNPAYRISRSTDPSNWGAVPTSSNSTWNSAEIVAGSNGYRLPTEAQWEYAAKGGNGTPGDYTYSGSNTVGDVAWYRENSSLRTHEVGKKTPNGLGIYDMSGNVFEWCWDWYGDYSSGAQTDPQGAASGDYRVLRGGCWLYIAYRASSVDRTYYDPNDRYYYHGFRLVRP